MSATVEKPPSAQVAAPPLPEPRGPVSSAVLAALRGAACPECPDVGPAISAANPYRDDIQLAMYCLYELHYRGFAEVAEELEWEPALLAVRRELERSFLAGLRRDVPPGTDVQAEIAELLTEPADVDGRGVSHHLMRDGTLRQLREYLALRSLYHLKEADPQAWVIPRLHGAAKAALVTVEHDEYGAGDPERMHAELFARMLRALDMDDAYGAYLNAAPAEALAEVNFMSMCGLHRPLRGSLIGQFVTVELTSSPGSDRLVRAMRRLGLGPDAIEFYAEHVEADAVHEQVVRRDVLAPLLGAEPELAADVVFGIRASVHLAEHLESRLLRRWSDGQSSLRRQLPS
ncbi:MAG TPA: iron-containing redox enzyme family protein [Pseudonocardia sp.]|uniref:iron-containing redox enzyme family protein n=1 Tax=Pseudonocardia sp. TaxID=60912 RepID=UPI002BC0D064|nr:iron-containing redox enzyme family protein [Pseudonocardia sp.]HTF50218.1 iron-containing redox enzyme family protein [Pseudonocardia sp.]